MMFKHKTFPGQEPDEEILLFLRRYWLSFLPTLLIGAVMILLPLFLLLVGRAGQFSFAELKSVVVLGLSSYYLFILAFLLNSFIDYYFDITIITNRRVIDIGQKGLFAREISQQPFNTIQDASAKKRGILQTFFNYGDVFLQTAAELPNFNLRYLPDPSKVAQKIMELRFQYVGPRNQLGQPVNPPPAAHQEQAGKPPAPLAPSGPPKTISEEKLKEGGEIELPK